MSSEQGMVVSSRYRFRAARLDGTMATGTVSAASADAASALLAERGLFPIDVRASSEIDRRSERISVADLALGLRVLGDLLDSGLPVGRALAALEELTPPSWAAALPTVRAAVREGQSLASALAAAPVTIPPLVIGIIQAGEAGSGLAQSVRRAAEVTESAAATRAAIRSALAYPAVLAVAAMAAIWLLVGVVMPRFATILDGLGQTLPASTRLVLAAATAARVGALPALSIVLVSVLLGRAWTSTEPGRRRWHRTLLALPVVGTIRRSAATARAATALAALLDSGVPIGRALLHAAAASGDAALAHRLRMAREAVVHGAALSGALAQHEAGTPTLLRLVRAGEESGRLSDMLAHAGRLERERATELTRGAVRLLEPALVLAFGALVALVAAALLQAVYSVRPQA